MASFWSVRLKLRLKKVSSILPIVSPPLSMGGSHIDAPYHFSKEGNTLDAVPLERLMGPGVVIVVSSQRGHNPDFQIQIEDLKTWEKNYGQIQSVFRRFATRSEELPRD